MKIIELKNTVKRKIHWMGLTVMFRVQNNKSMTWSGINVTYPIWTIDSVIGGTNVFIWKLKRSRDNKTKQIFENNEISPILL